MSSCLRHRVAGGRVLAALLLTTCGGCTVANNAPDAGSASRYSSLPGFSAYQRRCEGLDRTLQQARVVYQAETTMTRGDPSLVAAAVTLDQTTPPDQLLRRSGATGESGFLVSCHVQARLGASQYSFELDQTDWVDRSLLTANTARWSWYVRPKIGGTQTLVLQVRPVVKIRAGNADTTTAAEGNASIAEFETKVHVTVPWTERPQETMTRLAATFNVAEGLVKAMTGLLTAVLALFGALGLGRLIGWLRARYRNRRPPSTTTG